LTGKIVANTDGGTLVWRDYKPVWTAKCGLSSGRDLYLWWWDGEWFVGVQTEDFNGRVAYARRYTEYLKRITLAAGVGEDELAEAAGTLLATAELLGHAAVAD
jgi:hypothetical protein